MTRATCSLLMRAAACPRGGSARPRRHLARVGEQELDRDALVELRVTRRDDDAHAARAEHALDLVLAGEDLPGLHGRRRRARGPAATPPIGVVGAIAGSRRARSSGPGGRSSRSSGSTARASTVSVLASARARRTTSARPPRRARGTRRTCRCAPGRGARTSAASPPRQNARIVSSSRQSMSALARVREGGIVVSVGTARPLSAAFLRRRLVPPRTRLAAARASRPRGRASRQRSPARARRGRTSTSRDERFAAFLGGRVPAAELETARAADLWAACACGTGDGRAIAAVEARYFPDVDAALGKMGLSADRIGEVKQGLRRVLFVGDPGRGHRAAHHRVPRHRRSARVAPRDGDARRAQAAPQGEPRDPDRRRAPRGARAARTIPSSRT